MQKKLVAVFLLFCAGCASSRPNYFPSIGLKMPPKKSADQVEVRSMPPTRACFAIGELYVGSTHSWGKIISKTTVQAAQIGADFVWLADRSVQTEDIYIPGFSSFSASGSAYGYGYGNWFTAQAHSQASGYSVGPSVRRVQRGTLLAIVGLYYPAKIGVTWDTERAPKCVVKEFTFGSNAETGGLQVGDEILAMDGIEVRSDNLPRHLLQVQPGQKVKLAIMRSGQRLDVDVETIPN